MTREEKNKVIDSLAHELQNAKHFYITDISALNAEKTSSLRRKCFENQIKLIVAKNTLLKNALQKIEGEYDELFSALKGNSAIMLTETGNVPAKLIKELRRDNDKPILKAAFVEECIYIGDNQIDALVSVKSKDELLGDIILLLQSPMKNVVSSLLSGSSTIAGLVKTLSEKKN
ncbi:MAG: 50S ribosomal protein L10 [Bacteroidetes bacterium GWF2_38_335]|nr:MAG: 50S ribosomal protein L10 [Bacteroidetes bacterium GWF2_38_335]OFY80146.1 MAG: 50S ribosomal protein L10 [Bacteroidetes bacterium RIFOXYA12_FULL_38_20]HBS88527.1 50S ribosomal protein L10 [Bacteroidales bacterium]